MIKIAFWRMVASAMGIAVRRKTIFERLMDYAPYTIAGAVAFILGRLIGELLL